MRIDHLFLPFEAEKIKSIPLCVTNQADDMAEMQGWNILCENWLSVVVRKMESPNRASGSDIASKSVFWRRLWKMKVPNKTKIFRWHACSEAFLTRSNLLRRKVLDDPTCSQCGNGHENSSMRYGIANSFIRSRKRYLDGLGRTIQ